MTPIFPTLEGWTARAQPLAARAVVARGDAARALARRLLDRSDEELHRLRGAATREVLLLGGAFEALPWADGAVYLGGEGALLWPVHLAPPCAPELLERALHGRFPHFAAPLVVVPSWKLVWPHGEALPLRRERLVAHLEETS